MSSSEPKFEARATAQAKLYAMLKRSGDVSFLDIYSELGGDPARRTEIDARGRHYAQSWVSTSIRRLNKRLAPVGLRVVPGRVRRTYCLAPAAR